MNTPTVLMAVVKTPAPAACIAEVELPSGWQVHVDWTGTHFDALVLGPYPHRGLELRAWETLEDVRESLATYFDGLGLHPTFVAIWASVQAELRS